MTYRPFNSMISTATTMKFYNGSGSTIDKAMPVRASAGGIDLIDVSNLNANSIVGVTQESIGNGASGNISNSGKISNITTSFNFDDEIYVSKTGELTNIKPAVGVNGFLAGDFTIKIGVITENDITPGNKDLLLLIQVIGTL